MNLIKLTTQKLRTHYALDTYFYNLYESLRNFIKKSLLRYNTNSIYILVDISIMFITSFKLFIINVYCIK